MTVYLLPEEPFFPPAEEADPDGLIAIGGDLSPERLLQAYASGIFPWFAEEGDIFWYSPDPRMVLFPDQYRTGRSFGRIVKSNPYEVRFDTCFEEVIRACAEADRPGQDGTWISPDFIDGYTRLHSLGFAHSAETFHNGKLVGGLYGVSIGAAFFGESMFYRAGNASKVAFHSLVGKIRNMGFLFIDCQVETTHLAGFGAMPIPRSEYLSLLAKALKQPTHRGPW